MNSHKVNNTDNAQSESERIIYTLAISYIKGLGVLGGRKLLSLYPDPRQAFDKYMEQSLLPDSKKLLFKAEKEMEFIEKESIRAYPLCSPSYPELLADCPDAPLILFVKSKEEFKKIDSLAIVGTRKSSFYGLSQTEKVISGLEHSKIYTVSGLATGIDTQVHKSSIKHNVPTIAVLAHGLDDVYPPENTRLANEIIENGGAIISEMKSQTQIKAGLFPRRNRIIAGLSRAVVVIEAAIKGGALITARIAHSYNRTIFAIPGKNDSYYSQGCNYLIKEQMACLLENSDDIKRELQLESDLRLNGLFKSTNENENNSSLSSMHASTLQNEILEIIKRESPASVELLCKETETELPKILSALIPLEIAGIIRNLPGNMYAYI